MTQNLLTVKLEKLAYGGDALGRLSDGRAVFVPFALPGEKVSIRSVEDKTGHVRAELVEILESSPGRISSKCRHFGDCGGCHYQDLPYKSQLAAKTEILSDQLKRIGRIENPPVNPIIPSPTEWNYRNHVQFHLTDDGRLGFINAQNRGVLPITECHLPEISLNTLWPRLDFEPGLELERISLRLGLDEEIMLTLESDSPRLPEMDLGTDISVVHLAGREAVVMAGDDHLTMKVNDGIHDRLFHLSAASFFQVNTGMAGKMAAHLQAQLPVSPASTLLDVYCGAGLFSAFFAPLVGRLIGIESSPTACEDFTINLDEFDHVELYEAPAEEVLPRLEVKPDFVIVDPPRAGLLRGTLDALLGCSPDRIAYVSCDPSTLARDAARLITGGYQLTQVTPFDLFPQTFHIESISIFEKSERHP